MRLKRIAVLGAVLTAALAGRAWGANVGATEPQPSEQQTSSQQGTTQQNTESPTTQKQDAEHAAGLGAIVPYLGVLIEEMEISGIGPEEATRLLAGTPLKIGDPLARDALHDAVEALFATGRFSDIEVEAERSTSGVRLKFRVTFNYFMGQVLVEGVTTNPSPNQLVTASRLQLGELWTNDKIDRAKASIQRVLEENGYHRAEVTSTEQRYAQQWQVNITFHVRTGPRALTGQIELEGDAGASKQEIIEETGKLHTGDPIVSSRLTRTLQRIRALYQKQQRLLAQVAVAKREYHADKNTVDYTFRIDRGPVVEVAAEGFKISRLRLKRLVPIYEEGAVDDDLLNEGRRNLQNHLQTLGYFAATVTVSQHRVEDGKALRVVYTINPGDRQKLAAIRVSGNKLFSYEQIRGRMQCQTASRFFSHGRFSQALLDEDVSSVRDLYRSSGYQRVEVTSKIVDKYQNDASLIAIDLSVKEGPQTRVAWVRIEGNYLIPSEQVLQYPATEEGQGFDESNLADDRDTILGVYLNNGFPNASVDVAYVAAEPLANGLPRVGVTFTIHEGEQFFVNQVFLSGLHFTRPGVARRELEVKQGAPLSQRDMLETQRRLYDLGLFNEVDTAVQNPDGTEVRKNVLIATQEAKRYTFDYGVGFEFQTGQPAVGTSQPLGETGVSPRVSFGVTRINFGGRNQTITAKGNLGRLQQRALLNFEAPKLLNRDLRFSATGFYDNTIDVSTFTSKRLEGSLQTVQVLEKDLSGRELTSIAYRFTYRRVQATNIEVATNLIPLLSRPTRVGMPNFTYIRNRRDNDLETTHGNYTTVDGGVAASYFGSEADFSRLLIKNSTYHPFALTRGAQKKFVFARSTTIGVENPFGNTVLIEPSEGAPSGHTLIPLPERFFSGGGNSHRGFGLNQAGPRDPITGFPVGGSALFVNNLEVRFPSITLPYLQDNIGFTVFHDMGNVFARPQDMTKSLLRWHQPNQEVCVHAPPEGTLSRCSYNYLSHAIGLGVRYQTPIGPLRFDFGYNLNPPVFPAYTNITINTVNGHETGVFGWQRAGHFNFSFSIGQSF